MSVCLYVCMCVCVCVDGFWLDERAISFTKPMREAKEKAAEAILSGL